MGCTWGEGSRRRDEHLHALAWQRTVRCLEMRWDVPIILRQCNEGGHHQSATECNQVQPSAVKCNRMQSSAIECNQVQPSAITWSARRTEATAILTGIQLPSAITCGRGMVRRGGHLHARSRDSQGSNLESAMYPEHSSGGVGEERANLDDLLTAGDTGSSALDGIGEGAHAALYVGLEV